MITQAKNLKKALIEVGATRFGEKPRVRTETYVAKGDRYYGHAVAHVDALSEEQIMNLKEILPYAKIQNLPNDHFAIVRL